MKLYKYIYFFLFLTLLSSCVVRKNAVQTSPFNTQVNFVYDDIEYITEVSGTSTQSYLFGLIPVGGRRNHQGVFSTTFLNNSPVTLKLNKRGLNNALYDAISSKPDADYIIPVSYKVETTVMFFGRKETLTVKAKAVKIRNKKAEPNRPVNTIEEEEKK